MSFDDTTSISDWRELGRLDRAVVVIAHPDDETFCSGLIASLVQFGVTVEILCLTRGEGGPTGGGTRESLGQCREEEMRKACEVLGVQKLRFLDYIDPTAKGYRVFAPAVSSADLAMDLQDILAGADLILSHGSCGEYWHPAHLLVFESVKRIRNGRGLGGTWLTFLARQPGHQIPRLINWDDPVHLSFDASSYAELREEALACHESQLGLFRRFGGGELSDFIEKTASETYALQAVPATDRGSD